MATSIPPHNVGELIDAAMQLIDNPRLDDRELMEIVKGPDFPTGGVLVDSRETIASRLRQRTRLVPASRARIEVEREKGGGWHLLVSEIPYGVQKGEADRADRPADRRQEAADPRRRQRRERRAGPPDPRAAGANVDPDCCSRACTG